MAKKERLKTILQVSKLVIVYLCISCAQYFWHVYFLNYNICTISPHITKTNSDHNETTSLSSSSCLGLVSNPSTTVYSGTGDRIQQYLVYQMLRKDHSMERDDKVGWAKMYKIMTGRDYDDSKKPYHAACSWNKYWRYQHGRGPSDVGYGIHPLDQKILRQFSINDLKDMGKIFGDVVFEQYGISDWTGPNYDTIHAMSGLDKLWKDFGTVLANLKNAPNNKNNKFIIQYLNAETGFCPTFNKEQWAKLAESPARQTEKFHVYQCFNNILLDLGGGVSDRSERLPRKEEISKRFDIWMGENPDMVGANEATNRLSLEQNKLAAAVSNNFKPSLGSVHKVDKKWLDNALSTRREKEIGRRLFMYKLRYVYGKKGTPIPRHLRHLVEAATAPENENMYLMMFDLHHDGEVAVEQKRRDKLELRRSDPSELNEQELDDRAHLFAFLSATDHAFVTLGEVPAFLNSTKYRSRSIKYGLVEELEEHVLGPGCTMSREVLPGHIVDGHHDAEGLDIKEGNTVHPTAKVCTRDGLYKQKKESVESWLIRLFKEVLKKTRLKKEWHRFLHFVLNNLDWFKEHFKIDYPYEVRRGKLVRTKPIESGMSSLFLLCITY